MGVESGARDLGDTRNESDDRAPYDISGNFHIAGAPIQREQYNSAAPSDLF